MMKYPGAEHCKKKHARYVWPSTTGSMEAVVLCDSLLKNMNGLRRTIVQSVPGATIERLTSDIVRGIIDVSPFKLVAVLAGTNNLESDPPPIICERMSVLHDTIRSHNPECKILISGLLHRARDEDNDIKWTVRGEPRLSKARDETNTLLEAMVSEKQATFLKTWKTLMNKTVLNCGLYANDGLHLTDHGVYRVKLSLLSNIGRSLAVHPPRRTDAQT